MSQRDSIQLSKPQIAALLAAYRDADGWITRGSLRADTAMPRTVLALEQRGLMQIETRHRLRTRRARITDRGRRLVEHMAKAHEMSFEKQTTEPFS